jgi:PKD repeat protein
MKTNAFLPSLQIIWQSLLILSLFTGIGVSAQILPASRTLAGTGSWHGLVGVPGGIPNRTAIYTTIPAGAAVSTVQNAINACPSGQVVLLSAGNYSWSGSLNMKSGVTLRGAGQNATVITSSANYAIIFQGYSCMIGNQGANGAGVHHASWTGGYAQGSTSLTLSTTANLSVGQVITIDQLNDADTTAVGAEGTSTGCYSTTADPANGSDRFQFQSAIVTAISGNVVTISEPVYMPNYASSHSPSAWWEDNGVTQMRAAGVEALTVQCSSSANSSSGITMSGCYGCWVQNVTLKNYRYHCQNYGMNIRCEFSHCTLSGYGNTDCYGFYPKWQFGTLYENNIGINCGTMFLIQACAGCVIAYNYATNCQLSTSYLGGVYYCHGGNPNMCLFEGNWGPEFEMDNTWGSAAYNVALRNRFTGNSDSVLGDTGNAQAIGCSATSRHMTVMGNVLGTTGYNNIYEDGPAGCIGSPRVYYFGGTSGCNGTYDPLTKSTMFRAFNWTSATTTNNGIATDGYQASDIPNSLYLTSKPSFFGSLPWPAIDPANVTYSLSRTNIPSGYRAILGMDPPTGPVSPVNQPPVAVAAATPTSGTAPLVVNFSSSGSYDPEGTRLTYRWTFGDGMTNTNANPSHTYTLAGDYLVQLQVSDGTNSTTTGNLLIHVAGLLAAYGFEETNGTQIINAVTGQADGNFTNATRVAGLYGAALAFNGSNSVASITDALVSSIASNLTIEAWVSPTATGSWRPVLGKADNQSQLAYVLQGVTPQSSLPSLYLAPGPGNLAGTAPLPTNTWSHLAATFDGSNLCLYVNGALVASRQQTGALSPANTPLTIGSDGLLEAFWSGTIDEVRIYNTALSATAIQSDMNTPVMSLKPAPPQNLRVVTPP